MKFIGSILSLLLLSLNSFGQITAINDYITTNFKESFNGGVILHSNGWGINLQYLSNKSNAKNLIINLDITTLKDPKESSVVNSAYEGAKPYVFGKINSIIALRPGFGNQFIITDKETPLGIKVNLNFVIGATIALLKPVYLQFLYKDPVTGNYDAPKTERYDPVNNPVHNDQGNIIGGASYFLGFDHLNADIGGFAKLAMNFEWNNFESSYKFLEAGIMADIFPDRLPIFAYIQNRYLFLNLYVNLSIGKRW